MYCSAAKIDGRTVGTLALHFEFKGIEINTTIVFFNLLAAEKFQ